MTYYKYECVCLTIGRNYERVFLNGLNSTGSLLVSTVKYEPFMYRHVNGSFYNGIEFKLIDTMTKKERLVLSFLDQLSTIDNSHDFFKYF